MLPMVASCLFYVGAEEMLESGMDHWFSAVNVSKKLDGFVRKSGLNMDKRFHKRRPNGSLIPNLK